MLAFPAVDPVVIVNPRSGKGLSQQRWAKLVASLSANLGPFETRFTEHRGHARLIARQEALAGRPLVVAFGGDGTISEVVDGLMAAGTPTEMGILPRGTGGDLRRTLGLPTSVGAAAEHMRNATVHLVDVGRATFSGDAGEPTVRHFINAASFGFSSAVALKANQSSKTFGAKASFLSATLRSLLSYENAEVLISVDGGEPQRRTILLGAVGNGRYFGGGMKICPEAQLDSGQLELVTVGDLSKLEIVAKIHRIYQGTHLTLPDVRAARATKVQVWPADPAAQIPIELDGETPGTLPATFEVLPRALRLRF